MILRLLGAPLLIALTGFAPAAAPSAAMQALLDYAQSQRTTGLLVVQDGRVLAERNWAPGPGSEGFMATSVHGTGKDGALLEDVASQQKSFVAVLTAVAVDKGLLDPDRPVSAYLGAGWSKASQEQEGAIRVSHLLTMSSGLTPDFAYAAPAGSVFLYNTPVYAVTKRVLEAAAHRPLDAITREWLTVPLGMDETGWRRRPPAFADVGNPTGLVTTPRDAARLGAMVLADGRAADGRRVVSSSQLRALFARSPANPAYGRLWWLNGSTSTVRAGGVRVDGPLIPTAPPDVVAALGALDRKLYVSPGHRLVVVRMGQAAPDKDFDARLWSKLSLAIH